MNPQFISLAISATMLILPVIVATQDVAQSQRPRKLEIRVSEKVPVKLKINDEAVSAFRVNDNREWSKDFKVEFTNTGTKPIYFLRLKLITDVREEEQLSFIMDFGRSDLLVPRHRARENDASIKPEETKTLVLPSNEVERWIDKVKRQAHPDALRAWLVIDMVNFGDGTGFSGNVPFKI